MKLVCLTVVALLVACTVFAGGAGYENIPWGSSLDTVIKKFPHGQKLRLGQGGLYRQTKPDQRIARRMFGFDNGGLHTVTIVFEQAYVKKQTLETLVAVLSKQYGEAHIDRSQAPEKLSLQWEKDGSKITLGYFPKRLDMTVMIFEKK